MRLVQTALVLAALILPAAAATPASAPSLPDLPRRAHIAARLHTAIQMYFAHWEGVPDLDFDQLFERYLQRAMAAGTRKEYDLAGMELVAGLHNAHTWFIDTALRPTLGGPLGFALRDLGGQWVVTSSRRSGLHPGDVVASIDGRSFESFYQEQRRYLSASTEAHARVVLTNDSYAPFLFPETFVLTLQDGREVAVDRRQTTEPTAVETEGRWLEKDRLALVAIPSFDARRFEERALELVDEYKAAPALIVDLRGNGGGSTPGRLLQALMDRPYRWFAESVPAILGVRHARGAVTIHSPAFSRQGGEGAYAGKMVILVDAGCLSACEDFTAAFKDNGRAILVGENTGGSSGQPYMMTLEEGFNIGVGAVREFLPDGSAFEGVGIAPDHRVTVTAADVREGKDPVLEEAIRLLSRP